MMATFLQLLKLAFDSFPNIYMIIISITAAIEQAVQFYNQGTIPEHLPFWFNRVDAESRAEAVKKCLLGTLPHFL